MKNHGFTLIELMITVAIVAILASVALPAYNDSIRRGKIIDATGALGQYRVAMEQYFQDNRNYGPAGGACPAAPLPISNYFSFACTVGNPNSTFSATATSTAGGVSPTAGDYVYSINEINAKGTSAFKGTSLTKNCWLVKGGEC